MQTLRTFSWNNNCYIVSITQLFNDTVQSNVTRKSISRIYLELLRVKRRLRMILRRSLGRLAAHVWWQSACHYGNDGLCLVSANLGSSFHHLRVEYKQMPRSMENWILYTIYIHIYFRVYRIRYWVIFRLFNPEVFSILWM